MAFFISPGVQVREFDISTVITQNANSAAAYVGSFEWGPVEEVTTISSKARLQKYFGNPTNENALHWFSCSNFLEYANNLKVVRVVNEDVARNATVAGGKAEAEYNQIKETANLELIAQEVKDMLKEYNTNANLIEISTRNLQVYTQTKASYGDITTSGSKLYELNQDVQTKTSEIADITSQIESKTTEKNNKSTSYNNTVAAFIEFNVAYSSIVILILLQLIMQRSPVAKVAPSKV